MYHFPQPIKPELINDGDTIRVTYPEDKGVQVTKTAVVARRTDIGGVRYLIAEGDGIILAWEPGRKNVKVELLARAETPQQTLWSDREDLHERLTG